jgi:hypothetical protein
MGRRATDQSSRLQSRCGRVTSQSQAGSWGRQTPVRLPTTSWRECRRRQSQSSLALRGQTAGHTDDTFGVLAGMSVAVVVVLACHACRRQRSEVVFRLSCNSCLASEVPQPTKQREAQGEHLDEGRCVAGKWH